MSLIFLFIGLYILYLLLRPAIRVWRAWSKMKNGTFDPFADFFGQPGAQKRSSAYAADGSRKGGWSRPGIKKKKIAGDVGEYVKFTEITESESVGADRPGSSSYTAVEQQIVDVDWVDLPPESNSSK